MNDSQKCILCISGYHSLLPYMHVGTVERVTMDDRWAQRTVGVAVMVLAENMDGEWDWVKLGELGSIDVRGDETGLL